MTGPYSLLQKMAVLHLYDVTHKDVMLSADIFGMQIVFDIFKCETKASHLMWLLPRTIITKIVGHILIFVRWRVYRCFYVADSTVIGPRCNQGAVNGQHVLSRWS